MLREVISTSTDPSEPNRRWYFSHTMDLIIWLGDDGEPASFQLAYDKYRNERLVAGGFGRALEHFSVDDGEHDNGFGQSPLLHPLTEADLPSILESFELEAQSLPDSIRAFVSHMIMPSGSVTEARHTPANSRALHPGSSI